MAVEVELNTVKTTHADAGGLVVNNGHLFVMSSKHSNADTVAVYAPGNWSNAVIVPAHKS